MLKMICLIISILNSTWVYPLDKVLVEKVSKSLEEINKGNDANYCHKLPEQHPQKISDILASLKVNEKSIDCEAVTVKGCEYTQCIAPADFLKSYPKPVAFLIPKGLTHPESLKVHFHGYTTFQNKWDKSLKSLIKSFEFGSATCLNKTQIISVPFSQNNKEADFVEHLGNENQFNAYIEEFQQIINHSFKDAITLSAHSGGGKIIGNILHANKNQNIEELQIYDGLYAKSWADKLHAWHIKNLSKKIKLYAIKDSAPATWSEYLLNKASGHESLSLTIESSHGGFHHWEINRDNWNN